jgi:hypothetical protein
MTTIDVDFDVYKELTMRRKSENDSCSDVIRRLLRAGETSPPSPVTVSKGATFKGVHFPNGTQFRVTYKGRTYTAEIRDGVWVDADGEFRASPSEAAHAITQTNVNGWRFWECKRPADQQWHLIDLLRSVDGLPVVKRRKVPDASS